jgi:hypothetical protein
MFPRELKASIHEGYEEIWRDEAATPRFVER